MTIRRFFCPPEQIIATSGWLDEGETRHLRDVLRLCSGETIQIFDGTGNEYSGKIETIEKRKTDISEIVKIGPPAAESSLDLTLAATLLKGDKIDSVVQKSVELGVNKLIPMTSGRCDVKVTNASKRTERLRRIAMEATKQCGRAKLLEIAELIKFQDLVALDQEEGTVRIIFSERDGTSFDSLKSPAKILAFIGPEGGWEDSELELAKSLEIQTITFGGRVMKADTAAVAIAAILQHRFGDMN